MVDDELALEKLIRTLQRRRKHRVDLLEPATTDDLSALEAKLGAQLPASVRRVFELCDGSMLPLSPMRPDRLVPSWSIYDASDGVVPLIECDIDPETGLQRGYGVAFDKPWGLLKERADDGYIDADFTLVEWFELVAKDLATYEWPAPRSITPLDEWTPCESLDEASLRDAPIGTAIASRVRRTKRNRIALELFVLVDPDRWVRSICRAEKDLDPTPVSEMCAKAAEQVSYLISRHPSQWAISATEVARVRRERDVFRGAVRIDLI